MTIEWASFITELASNPMLVAVTLLNVGVIVVNRATDAPSAIATVVSGAGVAFIHGAQDGQKFTGIFLLAITLATAFAQPEQMALPVWLMFLCALNMGIGTAIGGRAHHQERGREHGEAGALPRFCCQLRDVFLPYVFHFRRASGFYDAHEHDGYRGRGRGETQERGEVGVLRLAW